MKNEKLTFTCGEGGEAEEFFVVEQTRLNGVTYLLVADSEEDDAECLIIVLISAFARTLSMLAFSTFRIFPRIGRIA